MIYHLILCLGVSAAGCDSPKLLAEFDSFEDCAVSATTMKLTVQDAAAICVISYEDGMEGTR